jgi:hypothetical protein
MNRLEEYRRLKEAREPKKKKVEFTWKDWLGVVAILISAFTGYYNVIRQSDDVGVVLSWPPTPDTEVGDLALKSKKSALYATFINSGNRGAVISEAVFWFPQRSKESDADCTHIEFVDSMVPINIEPLVLKEKDVAVRLLSPRESVLEKDGSLVIPLAYEARTAASWWVAVCLGIGVVTPLGHHFKMLPLLKYDIKDKEWMKHTGQSYQPSQKLLQRTGSIFW